MRGKVFGQINLLVHACIIYEVGCIDWSNYTAIHWEGMELEINEKIWPFYYMDTWLFSMDNMTERVNELLGRFNI